MILSLRGMSLFLLMGLLLGPVSTGIAQEEEAEEVELLTPEQINMIKVWELPTDLNDLRVSIRVPREVMEEVFDKYRNDPSTPKGRVDQQAFLRRPMEEQLQLLFNLAPQNPSVRAYYADVQINGEPESMAEFRRRVYGNYVNRYFRRYFGEGQVPGVALASAPGNALVEMYTNFYILSTIQLDGRPMVNRQHPEDSLLLQWGLPRESAKYPAPDVPGWRAKFRGLDDENFQRIVEALELLYDNPNYGLDYELPGAEPEREE